MLIDTQITGTPKHTRKDTDSVPREIFNAVEATRLTLSTRNDVEFNQESMTEQRFSEDVDYDDAAIGEMLLNAYREQVYHSQREGLSFGQSSSSMSDRTGQPVVETMAKNHTFDLQVSSVQETQRHSSESEQIRTLVDRQREQILADCQAEIRKHEFQADYDRRSIQKLNETIESQKEEICRAHQGDERRRQDHQLLHAQLLQQNWESINEMEELKKFQSSTFDTIARRRLV